LFPVRIRKGTHKGELAWMPLRHWRVLRTLHNPRYAGAFVYGQRREARNPSTGKKTMINVPREQWFAFIPDAHPGYLSFEQFEANQSVLLANAQAHGRERDKGPAREGTALLQGLAICANCGRRMSVRYHLRRGVEVPDYQCMRECIDGAARRCLLIPGAGVDAAIGQLLLDTLTPLALEVALSVQTELQTRAEHADTLRRHHVERARHRADLARRRYLAVDPDNRLVADSLEADWNDALRAVQTANDEYQKATADAAIALSDEAKLRIQTLASDFPTLWCDPGTPQRERKRMIRLLIEDVTLAKTDHIHAHVRSRGGQTTSLTLPIPPKAWQARETNPDTLATLDRLLDEHTDGETAEALNAAGHRSGEGKPFTGRIVLDLRRAHHMPSHAERLRARGTAHHRRTRGAARCPSLHNQGLAPRRPARQQQGQRQERTALRAARTRRPATGQTHGKPPRQKSSHPTRARRCSVKSKPCRRNRLCCQRRRLPRPRRVGRCIGWLETELRGRSDGSGRRRPGLARRWAL
jgi:hypothetical protein